mgnify:FL=1
MDEMDAVVTKTELPLSYVKNDKRSVDRWPIAWI